MSQSHQGVNSIKKTLLITSINIDKTRLLYSQIKNINDAVIRKILQKLDCDVIDILESCNHASLPEIYEDSFSGNAVIFEWWLLDEDIQSIACDKQQVEYRFSLYHGSDGLSRIIDRGSLLPADLSDINEIRENITLYLMDFLQQYQFA